MAHPISSWATHAGREPADVVVAAMDDWWQGAREAHTPQAMCQWRGDALYSLMLVHVDRAAHKRRHQPTFVCKAKCGLADTDHGTTPMSDIIRDDSYGPQPLRVVHSEPESALAQAISMIRGHESTLTVAILSEAEFDDPDAFDDHRASLVNPLRDGVVLPIISVPLDEPETTDDAMARDDLLRAAGYAAYTFDLTGDDDDKTVHTTLAGLLEDIFDEVAGIKADAAARILSSNPLWPALVVRTLPEWRNDHANADASVITSEKARR